MKTILPLLALLGLVTLARAQEVRLTLEPKIQAALEASLRDVRGSAVVMDVHSGEILGMASNPCTTQAAPVFSAEAWQALSRDPKDSFSSGVVTAHPPGSVFLPVTALAALKSGAITPATILNCSGRLSIQNQEFNCWEKEGHGEENLTKTMSLNCGLFFYQVGVRTGIEALVEMAQRAGFGQPTGILEGEGTGSLPTSAWRKARREPWSDPDTATVAIGQGAITVTPLQMAVFMSALANGGTVLRPRLVRSGSDEKSGGGFARRWR